MPISTVLVPLDGSALAEAALPVAVDLLAGRRNSALLLLRVVDSPWPLPDEACSQHAMARVALEYLDAVVSRLTEFNGLVRKAVWYGPPAKCIAEAAEAERPDLIVMSAHGEGGLGRAALGSVAESVLRGTRIPILLVRDPTAPLEARRDARPAFQASI
jgi:nucleotide-binding universal stress UspA family protein